MGEDTGRNVSEPICSLVTYWRCRPFGPKRSAHDAVDAITKALLTGHRQVIDADLSKYFDTIPHVKLLAVVAERINDKAILALIKQWLKAPVVEEENGKRRTIGGGKGNRLTCICIFLTEYGSVGTCRVDMALNS